MDHQQSTLRSLLAPSLSRSLSLCKDVGVSVKSRSLPPSVVLCLDVASKLSGRNKTIALALLHTGCRIQEILNLRFVDVSITGHIFIQALKKSTSRVVYYPPFKAFICIPPRPPHDLLFPRHDYGKFRRAVVDLLPPDSPRSSVRLKVANLFRVAAADLALSLSDGDSSIPQEYLGHKSPRSTHFYLSNKGKTHG